MAVPSAVPPRPGPPPVRLVAPAVATPFAPGRGISLARVAGDGLRALDVRDGDHVVLAHREAAEHGDIAAVIEGQGPACLWKVYPEAGGLRLSLGHPALEHVAAAGARVQGVVVAVLRRPDAAPRPA